VNRILRIDTDRWVTGRAIRWACEEARLEGLPYDASEARYDFNRYGLPCRDGETPAVTVTVERNDAR
jgi:hypothetical protein